MVETILLVAGGVVLGGIILYVLVVFVLVTIFKIITGGWL